MIGIDDYAYSSRLMREMPKSKLLFGIIPMLLCLLLNSIFVSIITAVIMGYMSIKYTQISARKYLKLLAIPFGFLIISTLTIIFARYDIGREVLFGVPFAGSVYGVSISSLTYGSNLVFRAIGAVSCMYFISLNTPMNDIIYSLNALKLPKLLISLMQLIYSYIFVLLEEAAKMKTAQASRLGYASFKSAVKSTGGLIAMLFLRTYMRCDTIYAALGSRGYENEMHMLPKVYSNKNKNYLACKGIVSGIVLILVWLAERSFFV